MDRVNNIAPHILTTGFTTSIDEDNVTVLELNRRNVCKINECANAINELITKYEDLFNRLGFNNENGELYLRVQVEFESIKHDSAVLMQETQNVYNTDALSAIELAGCTTRQVNTCACLINRLVNNVDSMGDSLGLAVENGELYLSKGE